MATTLHQRLLLDIAELQTKPYPNISLHIQDEDITTACLILTAENYGVLHLTVDFPADYPLSPPRIQMDSSIKHPNVGGNYICASLLNTQEGYTPAYTLKGIAIQLLSFFSSDKIEQQHGGGSVNLKDYQENQKLDNRGELRDAPSRFCCVKCRLGSSGYMHPNASASSSSVSPGSSVLDSTHAANDLKELGDVQKVATGVQRASAAVQRAATVIRKVTTVGSNKTPRRAAAPSLTMKPKAHRNLQSAELPDEILLMICDNLETEDLFVFTEAWASIGPLITRYDVIRTRELRCFCLKQDYRETELGVGVSVSTNGKFGTISSEFDMLSQVGFQTHNIRRSVQGVSFEYWLPLPIAYNHWNTVKKEASARLQILARAARLEKVPDFKVIYHFMNDIVVKLNQQTETARQSRYNYYYGVVNGTLTHASEKAIESYFHLFHLLLCLASQGPLVQSANVMLRNFIEGKTSKIDCPSLGHIMVAALVSDVEMTDSLVKAIIKETVIRNVVWMLDPNGSNMPELAYLEPSEVSEYRLRETFQASKTSYRLLMFLRLFQQTAIGSPRKPLAVLRDEAFDRHGAPPRGTSKSLADGIKRIHQIDNFREFIAAMGLQVPPAAAFTAFLRDCIQESLKKGYSRMPLSQEEALTLRLVKEPEVEIAEGLHGQVLNYLEIPPVSFFPGKPGGESQRGGPQRGRGRGRHATGYGRGRR